MKLDKILLDPSAVYESPMDVVEDASLEESDRIRVLRRWEYDARRLTDAEGEGMGEGDACATLEQVLEALGSLGAGPGEE